jgi:hypothetical protein
VTSGTETCNTDNDRLRSVHGDDIIAQRKPSTQGGYNDGQEQGSGQLRCHPGPYKLRFLSTLAGRTTQEIRHENGLYIIVKIVRDKLATFQQSRQAQSL